MSAIAPDTHPVTAGALQSLEMGKSMLLNTFKYVPDDKLTYSPAGTSKSALQIAAHCAVSNYGIAAMLRGEPSEINTFAQLFEYCNQEEAKFTSREQVLAAIDDSVENVKKAIQGVSPSQFEGLVGQGELQGPTPFFMNLPGIHMSMHSAQIDYLETTWGDMTTHFNG